MKTVNDIRNEFIGFFKDKGHTQVESSPLVPHNDPSLMFTNAGMVQFKNVFTGAEHRDYSRATTSQKCVRAGGKHNDLENVGYTARHHTFFEMLGNFSFGDYFKEEAISYAWELVSKNFGMPKDRLLITVHSSDEEAAELWKKIAGFDDDRIIRIPTDDNFWMMGDTGPCGPCSEIFFDQGEQLEGGPPGSENEDGDRFLEFWNLVFMQFEQEPDGDGGYKRKELPKPSIDTGMGLERMSALLQGKLSNYDIDLLRDIIEHSADLTGISPDGEQAPSHRVIADHLRAAAFLMADGVMPSNEGRGYVLRRIMRRGMRHAHLLGASDPLLYRLFPTLQAKMSEAFPELNRAASLITETLKMEEEKFQATLERGLKILNEEKERLSGKQQFPGDVAFKLYDTYGFPLDLTQDALRAEGISVDVEKFEACMEEQRRAARASWSGSGGEATEALWFDIFERDGGTEFLGYTNDAAEGLITTIVKDGKETDALIEGDGGIILTNQSPFYAESGGQVGDTGGFFTEAGHEAVVTDTKKALGKLWLHQVRVKKGRFSKGDAIEMRIDTRRRDAIRANHSGTHLMHEALRRVLGDHVTQKGSLQDDKRTRFDISHPKAVSAEEMAKIEAQVNAEIRANSPVETKVMALEEARETGAMALFGEKYDDEVRVVAMGTTGPSPLYEGREKQYSVELCGGTHVKRTGDIGLLKIISEGALSSGIRRVEAITGETALRYFEEQEEKLGQVAEMLKTSRQDAASRLQSLLEEKKSLEKEVQELRRKLAVGGGGASNDDSDVKDLSGLKFVGKVLDDIPPKELKPMADELKKKLGSGVIALIARNEGKASIVVAVTSDLTDQYDAVELVKIGAEALGGKGGGGRADMAQAGGPDADAANDGVAAIEKALG